MTRGPIHIVSAANAAYIPHTAAMLHSVFTHNASETLHVHFLHRESLARSELDALDGLCRNHGAHFHSVAISPERLKGLPIGGWYIEEAWYRVILAQALPEIARALWLDADVIVRSPLRKLWDTDLAGMPLAACPNALLHGAAADVQKMGILDRSKYFNTGVLVLDLELQRQERSDLALREAAEKNRQWIHFADQDVLNCVYHQRFQRLPLEWNLLTHSFINVPETLRVHGRTEFDAAMKRPRIVHFTGRTSKKPWSYTCSHPYQKEYLHHRAAAGWPAPDFADRNLKNIVLRQFPLRLRAIISAALRRNYQEMLSYLRAW